MSDTETTVLDISPGALSDYYDWLKQAAAGDVLVYWTGHLQIDRQVEIPESDVLRTVERMNIAQLNIIADRIHKDAGEGQILLSQKRVHYGCYEYRATRRRQMYGNAAVANDQLVPA
ncbi:hypothetical protein [Bradyrhizobium elkanii]|uniref:Uncharacterized protein n=1 Tax=Bradyrhizobium diazoefficiens TaxID=1355477 RepID=A0A809X7B5_9BRAD|nr:hypothetical protein [Bradyrhizobium elkanii]BCE22081.1 hypothetical protein XF1B_47620 [Bradyrhizobium diazoefficiens]WLB04136.1 hypothetical protein QNJ80_19985 [Bradyrhizobium elkanii]WLB84947.1 hypothetical protein QIH83_21320 [Bradyrhizobium elkanii]BCE48346.1 hypothetical protein XF4B_46950 [Bradyrhizobium diazoefficiens]BCE91862.1 hypothetical protein XF10B_46600 [Bradyrhizobium diazoefficiens]